MQFLKLRALVALLTAAVSPAAHMARHVAPKHRHAVPRHRHHHRARHRALLKLPRDYAQWSRVAGCEAGGWRVLGSDYPDSLGISRANFVAFGGTPQQPGAVSRRGMIMQIHVADRLIARYRVSVPDQYGCAAW
ncbi:MAG TPA: hypothetical protein VHU61_14970 [Solirubrobacteraceae bacterium]|jgi:hypothetical protein|nr:hypothetical protein [Solirubrobacteraceae bacterium]